MSLTKPTLNNLRAAGTTVGDLYFPQTELLLPFDGVNGATTTSDLSNKNHTLTFGGTAQLSTAQSKFGGTSLLLDGNSDYVNAGGSNSSFTWGTSDFTIECWIYLNSIGAYENIFSHSSPSVGIEWGLDGSSGFKIYMGGGSWFVNGTVTSSSGISTGQWIHIALVRNGSNFDTYVNGTKGGTTASSANSISAPSNNPYIGCNRGASHFIDGYIDDFRITIGRARYTSSFTAPTTAHLTSAGDVNKQIIVNSAADGVAIGTGGINQSRIAKAWVSFNAIPSTLGILDSYNISSVTDHGTGDYEVIFATAMSDANYSQVISSTEGGTNSGYGTYSTLDRSTTGRTADDSTTTSFGISNGQYGYGVRRDCSRTTVVIFGN